MPPKSQKEKNDLEIRRLSKLEGNKVCVDCPEKMPTMIDMTFKTFVCSQCATIHRELQYKVKGISMTSFSEEDIAEIAKGGNNVCNAQYLARGGKEFPIHGGSADMTKLRDYIKAKYVDKRWFSPDGLAEVPALVDSKRRASLVGATPSANTATRRASTTSVPTHSAPIVDLMSMQEPAKPAASSAAAFDPFGDSGSAGSAVSHDPFGQSSSGFDAFGSSAPTQHPHAAPAAAFDPFGSSSSAPAASNSHFSAFDSHPTTHSNGGFDAFGGGSSTNGHASFDAFGSHSNSTNTTATHFDPFSSNPFPQGQQSNFPPQNNFSNAPMPFIKVAPPAPAPAPVAATAPTPAAAPVKVPGFSAFDEIEVVSHAPPAGGSSNPFDAPTPNHPQQHHPQQHPQQHNPFGAPQPFHGHQQQQMPGYGGYPGQMPQQGYPANYPGGPQGYGYPQPAPGYPQSAPGYPQPAPGYPQPAPGYPPQPGYPGAGYPGYPQQAAPHGNFNPFGQPAAPAAPASQVSTPVAPDPFSAMGGMAWNSVGKSGPTTPAPSTAAAVVSPTPHPPQQPNNPFDMF